MPLRLSINLRSILALGLILTTGSFITSALAESDETITPPTTFTDFKKAQAHCADAGKYLLIACLRLGQSDRDSDQLDDILKKNEVFLNGDKAALLKYNVQENARIQTFREYFHVEEEGFPILLLLGKSGETLGIETGSFDQERALAAIENASPAVIKLPRGLALKRSIASALDADAKRKGANYHTPFRDWTLITGETFHGAVVQSTGETLTFETKTGDFKEVLSARLTRADLEYLQKKLNPESPAFP
ncbi:MAG: hypothetical protein AAGD22_13595 [Verrucomicrobiota bacterium]